MRNKDTPEIVAYNTGSMSPPTILDSFKEIAYHGSSHSIWAPTQSAGRNRLRILFNTSYSTSLGAHRLLMTPTTRCKNALLKKIVTLHLKLLPLTLLPCGPPHPAFPKTLMDFHLLTDVELDSIAHH